MLGPLDDLASIVLGRLAPHSALRIRKDELLLAMPREPGRVAEAAAVLAVTGGEGLGEGPLPLPRPGGGGLGSKKSSSSS